MTFFFSLNTPYIFLHLLYLVQKEHDVYFHMSTYSLNCKALYSSVLKNTAPILINLFFYHQYLYIFHKHLYHDVQIEEILICVG